MCNHAREAVELLGNASRKELDRNRMLQLALTRLLEVVGNAANCVSQAMRKNIPEIPWAEIIELSNRLVRDYDVVDSDLLWDTITDNLPPLIASLEKNASDS